MEYCNIFIFIFFVAVGEDDESDELNPEELKLHLELYEQEMVVLRRKCDELEQENENFTQVRFCDCDD